MAARYPVIAHELLSAEAAALAAPVLAQHNQLAEDLLGLSTAVLLAGDAATRATRLVVLQVNYQIEQGVDAAIYAGKRRGERDIDYKATSGELVRPGLLEEVAELIDEEDPDAPPDAWGDRGFSVVTSYR